MNSSAQSQAVSLFTLSRRAPMVLAAFALLGVVTQAGLHFSHAAAAAAGAVADMPAVHRVMASVTEPAYVLADSVDWSKVEVAAISAEASVAAYER